MIQTVLGLEKKIYEKGRFKSKNSCWDPTIIPKHNGIAQTEVQNGCHFNVAQRADCHKNARFPDDEPLGFTQIHSLRRF